MATRLLHTHSRPAAASRPASRQAATPSLAGRPLPSRRALVTVRASSTEVEEIDPYTGEVISKGNAMAKEASLKVKAGKYTWAYRVSDPSDAAAAAGKPTFLFLHGLGSASYSFRQVIKYLSGQNYNCVAPDWLGHGSSDKPGDFGYTERELVAELSNFVQAVGVKTPLYLVCHGYYLGQIGLKWALENEALVDKLVILNMPLTAKSPLAPSFAAYRNPLAFLRPKGNFDAITHYASGGPYAMQALDADVFQKPYNESPAATEALVKTIERNDFKTLSGSLDSEFETWRKPSLLLFGGADQYLDANEVPFQFLETKRTNMRIIPHTAKAGHYPQEDQGEVTADIIQRYVEDKIDLTNFKMQTSNLLERKDRRVK